VFADEARKVDVRLPGKGNSNSHGARPVHLTITMTKWIRTSRLSIKNSLSADEAREEDEEEDRQALEDSKDSAETADTRTAPVSYVKAVVLLLLYYSRA